MAVNLVEMAKEAIAMRKQVKKLQQELEAMTVEYANGGIKVVMRCDMTMESISIKPDVIDLSRIDKLERTLLENTNKAFKLAKEKSAAHMKCVTKNMGIEKLFDE